jgi:hypothetical protein
LTAGLFTLGGPAVFLMVICENVVLGVIRRRERPVVLS